MAADELRKCDEGSENSTTDPKSYENAGVLWYWGFGLTAVYAILVCIFVGPRLNELRSLDLNELGDLLAGVFSPLAFLWLVVGYLLQGRELRASVRALQLQGEELRNSVKQQEDLVAATRERTELENTAIRSRLEELDRSSRAVLELKYMGGSRSGSPPQIRHHFDITNFGKQITGVRVIHLDKDKQLARHPVIDAGDTVKFTIYRPLDHTEEGTFSITYLDSRMRNQTERFKFSMSNNEVECTLSELSTEL